MLENHISRSLNYFYITYVYRLLKMDQYVYMKLIAVTAVTAIRKDLIPPLDYN